MKKGYWTKRKGEIMKIADMDTFHIYNCMRFLCGCLVVDPIYNSKWADKRLRKHLRVLAAKLKEMTKEYHRREDMLREV